MIGRRRRNERGAATLELAVLAPGVLALVALTIVGGRVAMAHNAIEAAATEAARAASIERTAGAAQQKATASSSSTLANQDVDCVTSRVNVDTSGFAAPIGTPSQVVATVTCVVNLSDLSVPGIPGTITIDATVRSPIDTYRGRD